MPGSGSAWRSHGTRSCGGWARKRARGQVNTSRWLLMPMGGDIQDLALGLPSTVLPGPVQDFGHVLAVEVDVEVVLDELVGHRLFQVAAAGPGLGEAVDHVLDEVGAVQAVLNAHV